MEGEAAYLLQSEWKL